MVYLLLEGLSKPIDGAVPTRSTVWSTAWLGAARED